MRNIFYKTSFKHCSPWQIAQKEILRFFQDHVDTLNVIFYMFGFFKQMIQKALHLYFQTSVKLALHPREPNPLNLLTKS